MLDGEGGGKDVPKAAAKELRHRFEGMMHALHEQKGATLSISILEDGRVQDFVETHAGTLDAAFGETPMSESMRRALTRSDYVFSGMKAFHEMKEAFPSLLDEKGDRKPFHRFLRDVQAVDETYNRHYLRAEYGFVTAAADMAAKWERIEKDGDTYLLQYRTAGDANVRPEHAALDGITLPPSDPFWDSYYPPNGFGCRCNAVQVRRGTATETDRDEAMERGEKALRKDKRGIFRFNAGKERKTFPDYNPYTVKACKGCAKAKGKMGLAFVPENELCAACKMVRALANADAKQTRKMARPLQGTQIRTALFQHPIRISKASITEWTNQPNKFYQEKNRMLLRIHEVMKGVKYLGAAPPHKTKKGLVNSHIFCTDIKGEEQCIIVSEWSWGEFTLHSISDNPGKIKKYIKKG